MTVLNKCPACFTAEWTEELPKVAYWKNFHGIRVQQHCCLECSKKEHAVLIADGWQIEETI